MKEFYYTSKFHHKLSSWSIFNYLSKSVSRASRMQCQSVYNYRNKPVGAQNRVHWSISMKKIACQRNVRPITKQRRVINRFWGQWNEAVILTTEKYFVLGTILSTVHTLVDLILTIILGGNNNYYHHCRDEGTEVQKAFRQWSYQD